MLQLVYISTARAPIDQVLLDDILAVSRRNNDAAKVTGLLLSAGRRFLQVLEGPDDKVLATYARIQGDRRHKACVLLSCRTVAERGFGSWSMAYQQGGEAAGGEDLVSVVETITATVEDRNLRAQLIGFAQVHATAA